MTANRFSFKAWDKVCKEWIHEEPCHLIGENCLLGGWLDGVSIERLDDVVILQSTGLLDKSGKEIFEGDRWQRDSFIGIVTWQFGGWKLVKAHDSGCYQYPAFYSNADSGEIIGNIHENPELLETSDAL